MNLKSNGIGSLRVWVTTTCFGLKEYKRLLPKLYAISITAAVAHGMSTALPVYLKWGSWRKQIIMINRSILVCFCLIQKDSLTEWSFIKILNLFSVFYCMLKWRRRLKKQTDTPTMAETITNFGYSTKKTKDKNNRSVFINLKTQISLDSQICLSFKKAVSFFFFNSLSSVDQTIFILDCNHTKLYKKIYG